MGADVAEQPRLIGHLAVAKKYLLNCRVSSTLIKLSSVRLGASRDVRLSLVTRDK